ncbi:hypothetical protein A1O3_09046 [Capronia epimyces CBS 606.96]|uniref:Vacuolar segregation subunit 7 n=1 Tax=Capronia epimyces CBS 606.96 TaxID=1182542 RepID=W9XBP7_9EURO|nr:uncharacterized protein A1O3_09046 [Capronia epimyces CBS 606.96]EXJ77887.1 hypothetical protein A1O3_09046 [Capronia epimyces CBS 606.96]
MSGQLPDKVPAAGAGLPGSSQTSSQEVSPVRISRSVSAIPQLSRSRKNSQEFSPTRSTTGQHTTVPSAAAVQRALSAQRPILQSSSNDGVVDGVRSSDNRQLRSGQNSPSWPTSPRLKSPPPSKVGGRSQATKRSDPEQMQPNTSLKRLATLPNPEQATALHVPDGQDSTVPPSTLRASGRGPSAGGSALETVAESSVPSTPSIGPVATSPSDQKIDAHSLDQPAEPRPGPPTNKESETSGGDGSSKAPANKVESGRRSRAPSGSRPASELAKRSFTSLASAKNKLATDPPRTMTVETETVTSIPQLLGPDRGVSGRDGNGSVRTKPSNETIRPKKEKKRSARKAPSLHAGTVTSKADLFEARVASAVDEADSSDSDETFVYESNPPDNRPSRHHSRTPSATSLASQDQHGVRSKHGVRSGSHAIAGKKSMKFSNNAHNNHLDGETGPEGRANQRNTSTTPRHHHISRHGRPHHTSLFDADSPFTQGSKSSSPRTSTNNLSRFSRPNSPRLSNGRLPGSPRKGEAFDAYDDAADDERAPLIGSVRINRARHSRRPHSVTLRQMDFDDDYDRGYFGRYGGCIFLGVVVVIVCCGITALVMVLSRPLTDVSIKHIQNVLASEQELMLDLHVQAVNTNLFAITVNDLDVNLFAESPYVGMVAHRDHETGALRWASRRSRSISGSAWLPWHAADGVDEGTDPIDDPESGTPKMLLGRIFEFDSPLVFDASPLRRTLSSSVGEIRLAKPGNKTEEGGSARWERGLQHPFDLIARGVIKYQLPLSSKIRSAKIGGRVQVLPNDGESGDQT